MTTEPVGRLITKMAVPTIVAMMVTALYNMADTFFVGQLHSNSATGAIGVSFSLMTVMQALGFFFGQGSGNYISRQLGKHQTDDAAIMAASGAAMSFTAGLVVLVIGQLFLEPICLLLGSTPTILPYACDYLRFILIGAPYMMASFTLNNQLRFQGSALYAMIGIATGAVLNIALDPLLIFGLGLGVQGAAIATIISQLVSFILLVVGTTRPGNVHLHFKNIRFTGAIFAQVWKGGFPSLLRQGLISVATICLNLSAGVYGDAAIAAMSVVSRAMGMALSALIGFGQGFQPVCGFNYGAGLFDRVRKAFRFTVLTATAGLVVLSAIGFAFAPRIVAIFRDDPEVIAFGTTAMRIQCVTFSLGGVVMIANMMTQTMGKTVQASILAAARQGLFFIPAVLLLPTFLGALGVQMAQSVSDVFAFALALPMAISVLRGLDKEKAK
ncbi:MAG: MATE family efflux transporter [Clostridia bacterium]|nr:MATE family efflux transporter [Clostridia bacterium]